VWCWLRAAGCDLAQGYFITGALPLGQLAQWNALWDARRPGLGLACA
jgi:EAL domain-containing protein (putative c-di-GMP-specific phosphodiesterase class I)